MCWVWRTNNRRLHENVNNHTFFETETTYYQRHDSEQQLAHP